MYTNIVCYYYENGNQTCPHQGRAVASRFEVVRLNNACQRIKTHEAHPLGRSGGMPPKMWDFRPSELFLMQLKKQGLDDLLQP